MGLAAENMSTSRWEMERSPVTNPGAVRRPERRVLALGDSWGSVEQGEGARI